MADTLILCTPETTPELGLSPQESVLQIDLPMSLEEGWTRDRHSCRQIVVEVEIWENLGQFMTFMQSWWPGPPLTDPRPPLTLVHRNFDALPNLADTLADAQDLWGADVTATARPSEWRAVVPNAAVETPTVAPMQVPTVGGMPAPPPRVSPQNHGTPAPPPPIPGNVYTESRPAGHLSAPGAPTVPLAPGTAPAPSAPTQSHIPRIVLMWGQEGGLGTTQLARGLAHRLADKSPQNGAWQSVLVDFHTNAGLEVLAAGRATPHVGHMLFELDATAVRETIQADGPRTDIGIIPGFDVPTAAGILSSRPGEDEQRQFLGEHLRLLSQVVRGHIVIDAPAHLQHLIVHYVDAVVLVSSGSRVAGGQLIKNLLWLQRSPLGHGRNAIHWVVNMGTARTAHQGGPQELIRVLQQYIQAVPQPLVLRHCPEFLKYGSESDFPWNYSAALHRLLDQLTDGLQGQMPLSPLHPA